MLIIDVPKIRPAFLAIFAFCHVPFIHLAELAFNARISHHLLSSQHLPCFCVDDDRRIAAIRGKPVGLLLGGPLEPAPA
jgi:hypothetical protein